ncbi:MAG: sigma-54 dependent transcriptional regulator [Candidatus Cloacimonetes bacterium]|nr:sigma-54 dependent transcriptional regulator [Candidatus Cloacimonadota bacterium]
MDYKNARILAVDDNEDILFSLKLLLKNKVGLLTLEKDPAQIPQLMKKQDYDLILLDMNFTRDSISGQEGFYWQEQILAIDPESVIVFITAYGDVERAVQAIRKGAVDFVLKPWQNEKLLATISSALRLRQSRQENEKLKNLQNTLSSTLDQPFQDFIGQSVAMQEVFQTIRKVAHTDANILILGENGTGKELVARALHRNSPRNKKIFLSVDLGSITETLFESELFGHVKGAFTDARTNKPGRFEVAEGGTLFLDEIGNLTLPLQSKLLTVIEKREVTRVGANHPAPVNVRLICATNMPLYQMIAENRFRPDLLYRINTVEIKIPPLRNRTGDIKLLAEHFLKKINQKYNKKVKGISATALQKLENYPWFGNVRELQHALERAVIMGDVEILQPENFLLAPCEEKAGNFGSDSHNIEDVEKALIEKVVREKSGNISAAARELGLTRASLYRRLKRYGI